MNKTKKTKNLIETLEEKLKKFEEYKKRYELLEKKRLSKRQPLTFNNS